MKKDLRLSMRFAAAGALLALSACGGGAKEASAGVIPVERFVAANVALRSIPDTAAKADSLRKAALRKNRVTEKELRAFVRAQRDPKAMADVWERIAQAVEKESARQDSIYRATHPDSAAAADSAAGRFPRHGGLRIDPSTGEPVPENAPELTPPPPAGGPPRVGQGQVQPPRPRTKDPRRLPDAPRDTRPWIPPPAEIKRPQPEPAPPSSAPAPAPAPPAPPSAPPPAPAPAQP